MRFPEPYEPYLSEALAILINEHCVVESRYGVMLNLHHPRQRRGPCGQWFAIDVLRGIIQVASRVGDRVQCRDIHDRRQLLRYLRRLQSCD